ncbi:MAG TPA: hypothetical protein VKR32_07725 [Puia sp.]|nr:hypothetical protein [Puia sp.]
MQNIYRIFRPARVIYGSMLLLGVSASAQKNLLSVDWDRVTVVSKTTPTLQVVENPMLHKNSPIHEATFAALEALGADYVRYVPWFPYTKMAVAELKPPTTSETFWDFRYLDSTVSDFMTATAGHSVVLNFSTTPDWMWKTKELVKYPEDPYQVFWDYNQGTELRDTTVKQVADYFGRVMSWYTRGGFTDELGKFHKSDHHYKIPYWEVLNEPDGEHEISPKMYTRMYDAIVSELRKVSPATKYIGIAAAFESDPQRFEYFLNPKNHRPGVPLDGISYHHYSTPSFPGQKLEEYQYVFFEKASAFLDETRYIEAFRKRLSPRTITTINEIGTITNSTDGSDIEPGYWNASGAMYAYMFIELTKIGIDVAGESQLVGYPTQYPDVSMMDWKDAKPNARYWILKLIHDHFGPGDRYVTTSFEGGDLYAQAMYTGRGKMILLINPRDKEIKVNLPESVKGARVEWVDMDTNENPPADAQLTEAAITLKPFAVAVVEIK